MTAVKVTDLPTSELSSRWFRAMCESSGVCIMLCCNNHWAIFTCFKAALI